MNTFEIPIFKKAYELYKTFHKFRNLIPKKDRYTTFERCENTILDIIEGILHASQLPRQKKSGILETTSIKLNIARVFIRLLKDSKSLHNKQYIKLESIIDEIGRMLGGWIRSLS